MAENFDLLDQFSSALVKQSVDIIEFAESDKYCGHTLYPRQKVLLKLIFLQDFDSYDEAVIEEWQTSTDPDIEMLPLLEERIKYLKKMGYPHFRVNQLVGGRRSGKGFMTGIALAFKLFQLTQLDNASAYFGIPPGKSIYFSIVADSAEQAKAHQFEDAKNTIVGCKPLQDQKLISRVIAETVSVYTPNDKVRLQSLTSKGVKVDSDLASLQIKAFGTNSKTIRGSASLMFVFDEMAHLIGGESRLSDEELYRAAVPSLAQFAEDGMIFANSSPYQKTGMFYKLYEQAMEVDNGKPVFPDYFSFRFPSWEMYKDWALFSKTKKMGAMMRPPEEDPVLALEEKADPEKFAVEYRSHFAEVIDAFLNPQMVDRMFDPEWNEGILGRIPQPGTGAVNFFTYKGHGDPSSTEANFGIAIGHVETIKNEESGQDEDHVVFDLINAFFPDDFKDHTIDWLQVVPEITHLINAYRPFEFTFDQFDSRMSIQQLQENVRTMNIGTTNIYQVVATQAVNLRRAQHFKAALNLGRVHAPHPDTYNPIATRNPIELARNELKFLQIKNGRVDKQNIGPVRTKDIADCLMEVVDALIGSSIMGFGEHLANPIQMGAPGGYAIGRIGNTSIFEEFNDYYPHHSESGRVLPYMPERGRDPRRKKQQH